MHFYFKKSSWQRFSLLANQPIRAAGSQSEQLVCSYLLPVYTAEERVSLDVCEARLDLAPQPLLGILRSRREQTSVRDSGGYVRLMTVELLLVWVSGLEVGGNGVRGG